MIEEVLKPHLIDALWLAYSSQNCLVFPHQCIIDFNLASLKTNHNFSAFQHMEKKKSHDDFAHCIQGDKLFITDPLC